MSHASCGSALRAGHYAAILLAAPGASASGSAASTPVPKATTGDAPSPASGPTPVRDTISAHLIEAFASRAASGASVPEDVAALAKSNKDGALAVGLAAFDAFLQVNVSGPVLADADALNARLAKVWADAQPDATKRTLDGLHKTCLQRLEVDGVSPYAHIPHLELFALARFIIVDVLGQVDSDVIEIPSDEGALKYSLAWTRLRVNVWHYKLLTQPSLGPGSNFTRSSQWSDVPTLATAIFEGITNVRSQVISDEAWSLSDDTWGRDDKVQFLVEAANDYILLGRDDKARETLKEAAQTSGLVYALSGALGKRTKFQEKDISQLVVLAKSGVETPADDADEEQDARPEALPLNNDTLLEEIQFSKEANRNEDPKADLPAALADLAPDNQPQLSSLDQIILLTEATLKDAFSPVDTLTSAEILPYAVRVISDKSTNWQIYTQALLVRSRIEVHRSRTVERSVLQMQAVADQVLADTTAEAQVETKPDEHSTEADAPVIAVTAPDETTTTTTTSQTSKPTTFLPAPKASESAPAHVRLQYIHVLSSPPRWHLESELAYAWAGIGSLVSALEIFKRLRLWAEVALCLASSAATDDEDGRGSGGEEKAKGIVRWRLFQRTGQEEATVDADDEGISTEDAMHLKAANFTGPERKPSPPNAPRLWCILGDIEGDPAHYERAWEISNNRYARAQRSLGEHYLKVKEWEKALDAYKKATAVNRLSPDMWSRLGDISLRLARFQDAASAFNRSIGCASDTAGGEDARTWSNLGSALWSLFLEVTSEKQKEAKEEEEKPAAPPAGASEEDEDVAVAAPEKEEDPRRDPAKLLAQSLAAYKKGASIAHSNWRIWDNVVTLASRLQPPAVTDMIIALRNVLRIRKTEDAIDVDVLGALLQDVVLGKEQGSAGSGIYEPPRGSPERLVIRLVEEDILPLITKRSELWTLVSRLRSWRRDYTGAIEAAERAWRAAIGSAGSGLLPGAAADETSDWKSNAGAFAIVVERTDALVSMLENWGPEVDTIGPKWKGKARSAVRTVMGKARENFEGSDGWTVLEGLMENLKISS